MRRPINATQSLTDAVLAAVADVNALQGTTGQATQYELVRLLNELADGARHLATVPRLNGLRLVRLTFKDPYANTILIPLPRELWRLIDGGCDCTHCKGKPAGTAAYWDTLAVPVDPGFERTYTVHAPKHQEGGAP